MYREKVENLANRLELESNFIEGNPLSVELSLADILIIRLALLHYITSGVYKRDEDQETP